MERREIRPENWRAANPAACGQFADLLNHTGLRTN